LESTENEGSTFHLFLPSANTADHQANHERLTANLPPEAQVLVVEDDYYLLDGLRELLELYDGPYRLEVNTAVDGQQALDVIRHKQPDLIISDIMMPKLDGYGLLQEVRQNPDWTHIPIIFLTAKGDPKDIHRGLSSGVEEYIPKPYDGDELMEMVTTQLNRHFQRMEATAEDFEALKQSILNLLQTDFRTPLDSVSNYSSTLSSELEQARTANDLKHSLEGIQKGSLRISELVEDFITLAEVKTGEASHALKLRGTPMPNVGLLLHQASQTEEIRQKIDGLALHANANQPLPMVWIDYERFQIALVRLLSVVMDFCGHGQGTAVWLTAVADETHVHLAIRHDSRVLEPDLVALIELLFAEDDEQIIEKTSFGAALCLANGVIKVHHGRVQLTSTAQPNDTFTITLPIYHPETNTDLLT
ncbi:MAG: response regulator, partial [Anaerolineales bacterium]|nr:response regulator [Anaerolineales bacterium]